MKRWSRTLVAAALAAPLVASLAACSQGGGSGSGSNANMKAPACTAPKMAGMTTQAFDGETTSGTSTDPFDLNGKLVLDSGITEFSGMSSGAAASGFTAGTQFTVSVREACADPGEIAQSVLSGEEEEEASTASGVRSYDWTLPSAMSVADLSAAAEADSCIAGISEAGVAEIDSLPTDPLVPTQGHLSMLEAGLAYDQLTAAAVAKPVVIAIIDTGVDVKHEDLKQVLWQNADEIPGNGVDDDENGYKDDYNGYNFEDRVASPAAGAKWGGYHHGTHVAGLAAAQGGNGLGVSGVMHSGVRVMGLNVFGSTSGARVSDVVNAIRYAADNGADVINLSLGGSGRNASYESAINYAIKKGVIILAASGNDGTELTSTNFMAPGSYGSSYAGMINVGSIDSIDSSLSYFSNYSPTMVELGSPGAENSSSGKGVLSTYPGDKYIRAMGTSMATPVAAGGAAMAISMLRSRGYAPSPATVEAVLEVSSKTLTALTTKIRDGRAMNLRNLADYISRSYPVTNSPADPGIPEQDACAMGTSN